MTEEKAKPSQFKRVLTWVGIIAGTLITLGSATTLVAGWMGQLVFQHHLVEQGCDFNRTVANLHISIIKMRMEPIQQRLRRVERTWALKEGAEPVWEPTDEELEDRIDLENELKDLERELDRQRIVANISC